MLTTLKTRASVSGGLLVLATICLMSASGYGEVVNASLDTSVTSGWESTDNNGSDYDYALSSTAYDLGPGHTDNTEIIGSVSNLNLGSTSSYLQIGLVAKNRADDSLDWGWAPYMFNQSAVMLVHRDASNNIFIKAFDYNGSQGSSSSTINLGQVSAFDFDVDLVSDGTGAGGTLSVTVGSQTVSHHYGQDNWEYDYMNVQDDEFYGTFGQAYGIAQAFVENLNQDSAGTVSADVAFTVVPEPATMSLLALGGLAMIRRRRTL